MNMPVPKNSIPMRSGPGPFGHIDRGGMFTVLKVGENPTHDDDPGWYVHPEGTVADVASTDELRQDGITVPSAPSTQNSGLHRH